MKISMRAGEKLYLNGAVIAVDRKTSIELLNDAVFLLQAHVMQESDANTPIRQIYFVVQLILMEPAGAQAARERVLGMFDAVIAVFENSDVAEALRRARQAFDNRRYFETLKALRCLFDAEAARMVVGPDMNRRIA